MSASHDGHGTLQDQNPPPNTTIYVVGFCPGGRGDESSVGGFEWRRTPDEARNALQKLLSHDAELASDYVLRRVIIPPEIDAKDDEAVTDWLDSEADELWNTVAQGEYEPEELCNVCMIHEHDTCANNPVCPCCRDSMREGA